MLGTFYLLTSFGLMVVIVTATPVRRSDLIGNLLNNPAFDSTFCSVDGEIDSSDPCKPYCVCRNGRIICGQVTCTDNFEELNPKDRCEKIHLKTRCCHHYICIHENGTATMVYPVPEVSVPEGLYDERR